MISKLLNLKNTNKWLFWLLLPLIAIAAAIHFAMKLNVIGGKKDLKNTEKEVLDLEKEKNEAIKKAKELQNQAGEHDKKAQEHHNAADDAKAEAEIKEAQKADIDYDWHKK